MEGFSVDLRELSDAATIVGHLGRELRAGSTLSYWMEPSEVGDLPLAEVLADLKDATIRAAELLEKNSQVIAGRVADTEEAYRSLDEKYAAMLSDIRGAATERPGRRD